MVVCPYCGKAVVVKAPKGLPAGKYVARKCPECGGIFRMNKNFEVEPCRREDGEAK